MPEKPPPARARFLDATEAMLREAGVSGIGINDVVARSGAPVGSLYHYFPGGKTQLVVEALEIHADKSRQLFARFFNDRTSAAAALRSLFNTAADVFERTGANKACAIGSVALDLRESDRELRDVCRNTFEAWISVIAPQLPFADDRSRRSFAMTVVSALEGAFILGRATGSGEPFRAAGKWLAASIPKSRRRSR